MYCAPGTMTRSIWTFGSFSLIIGSKIVSCPLFSCGVERTSQKTLPPTLPGAAGAAAAGAAAGLVGSAATLTTAFGSGLAAAGSAGFAAAAGAGAVVGAGAAAGAAGLAASAGFGGTAVGVAAPQAATSAPALLTPKTASRRRRVMNRSLTNAPSSD